MKAVLRVSIHNMINNLLLSLLKLTVGIAAHSQAVISDAIHSAADVFETAIVIIGAKLSAKPPDEGHPYGHERFGGIAAILLALILGITGISIGVGGIVTILQGGYHQIKMPGMPAVLVAVFSIVVKEAMYRYTKSNAKRLASPALMADAWHHRLDALCSLGGLLGVLGARMGIPICDPIASVVICVFVVKAAVAIFRDAAEKIRSLDRRGK